MMFWSVPVALLPALAGAFLHGQARNSTFDYAGYEVAIVEAGGWYEDSKPIISSTPAFGFANNAANDWGFMVEPQPDMGKDSSAIPVENAWEAPAHASEALRSFTLSESFQC
ncbi:hypothetical protein IFM61392_10300 [Aspergillus lentulus]|uniref:Uncharacterized protein n=1 Tax=Aspergillus lentulus TaxID=293939 RepID=A0ABQ1B472_ASPLE|nr:hypothetical protein IFM60648_10087 [Aspergillus lentulus]GFG17943.1 hypothetical protein IFM61392_10300 [Aspergillus lentulus]